jgi:hypothetical protein
LDCVEVSENFRGFYGTGTWDCYYFFAH